MSATITAILGFLSVIALIMLFLALSDIADHEADLTLEWYIPGFAFLYLVHLQFLLFLRWILV